MYTVYIPCVRIGRVIRPVVSLSITVDFCRANLGRSPRKCNKSFGPNTLNRSACSHIFAFDAVFKFLAAGSSSITVNGFVTVFTSFVRFLGYDFHVVRCRFIRPVSYTLRSSTGFGGNANIPIPPQPYIILRSPVSFASEILFLSHFSR